MVERIIELRKKLEKTQKEFAELLGLSKSAVESYEYGRRDIPDRTIHDICRIFNVNEEWLRYGTGEMFIPQTRNQEIAVFFEQICSLDDDAFKKRLSIALARMDPAGWDAIEKFVDDLTKKEE